MISFDLYCYHACRLLMMTYEDDDLLLYQTGMGRKRTTIKIVSFRRMITLPAHRYLIV